MRTLYLFFCIISTIAVIAQPNDELKNLDEVLALLPAHDAKRAIQLVNDNIRIYQRFPEFYVAGIDRASAYTLNANGIQLTIIDEQPWTEPYAVASSFSHKRISESHPEVRILFSVDNIDIIKGSQQIFRQLREDGFSCVEIERKTIATELETPQPIFIPSIQPQNLPINTILSFVSDSTIRRYIQGMQDFVTRYCLNSNRDSVFRWLRNRFLETGVTNVAFDSFQYSSTWQQNVIATIPGTRYPKIEIIVGGHFDSYSSNLNLAPGADDNATGTTAAIEMARVLMLANYQPSVTLRFIGFAAEEVGLKGSADYARKAQDGKRNIQVMLNYDMLGYRNQSQPDRDFYIVWYPGSEAFSNLHATMARTYTTLNPVFTTNWRNASDSWSFYQRGYRTAFCIEHDFNPYYHTPNDLLQHLDIPYTREIIQAGLATVLTLDQPPPAITGLQVLDRGNGTSLFVRWDSLSFVDFSHYRISIGRTPGVYDTSYNQTSCSRTISGLITGTKYYIGVAAVDLISQPGIITTQSGTPNLVPLSPSGLTVQPTMNALQLKWYKNLEMDLRGYHIYRKTPADMSFVRLTVQPHLDTLWTDSDLLEGIHRYYVTAIDSAGYESSPSDTASCTPITPMTFNPLIITNNVGASDTLFFGEYFGATDWLDDFLGEVELPEKPGIDTFDVRWNIEGTYGIAIDIREPVSINRLSNTHILELQAGTDGYPLTLRWKPHRLPDGDFVLLDELTLGDSINVDMKNESTLVISHPSITSLQLVHYYTTRVFLNISSRWNIISIPLQMKDNQRTTIFPTAISDAYAYENGYFIQDTLNQGRGYWLKFNTNESFSLSGRPLLADTTYVSQGWNLIGSITLPLPATDVVSEPPSIIVSRFFGYMNGYYTADTLMPGYGYWVKVNSDGKLILKPLTIKN